MAGFPPTHGQVFTGKRLIHHQIWGALFSDKSIWWPISSTSPRSNRSNCFQFALKLWRDLGRSPVWKLPRTAINMGEDKSRWNNGRDSTKGYESAWADRSHFGGFSITGWPMVVASIVASILIQQFLNRTCCYSLKWPRLLLIFYTFAIVITQLVTEHCRVIFVESSGQSHCNAELLVHWGSLPDSILTKSWGVCNPCCCW